MDKIVIVCFGSQYTKLIARKIRELGVYTEIYSELPELTDNVKGVILSGGPKSVYKQKHDINLFNIKVPILGICYGMQLMNYIEGGSFINKPEYGKCDVKYNTTCKLFSDMSKISKVWMSHGDSINTLSENYDTICCSENSIISGIKNKTKEWYGLQFHPEVSHTMNGMLIFRNFLNICECDYNWSMTNYRDMRIKEIRDTVGDKKIISLVSGGVDSTVATKLCELALGEENVYPLYIDTGLMRKNETDEIKMIFKDNVNFRALDCSSEFLERKAFITDGELRRKKIGRVFMEIVTDELQDLNSEYLCQGTLYTDLIESGKGCGDKAATIKSHHNVNIPIIDNMKKKGLIVEPNRDLFKDEVRKLGIELGICEDFIYRHPFPGPGLALRIVGGDITNDRLKLLRDVDYIYISELKRLGLYNKIWQAFAVLIPIDVVGVIGDARNVGSIISLRAVISEDGMTSDIYDFDVNILCEIGTKIMNRYRQVGRVLYDLTQKPPGTIEYL